MCARPASTAGECRCRLIQAATEAFLEQGYRASVDAIAARAGVAKQTLYNNFANKEELFTEVGQLLADSITTDLVAESPALRQTLVRFGLTVRGRMLSDDGIGIHRSFVAESARIPELNALRKRAQETLRARLEPILSKGMARGELKQDDAEFAAQMLLAMLVDADRHPRIAGTPMLSGKPEQQRVERIVDCFLRAFQP